jgi:hypothetical protein
VYADSAYSRSASNAAFALGGWNFPRGFPDLFQVASMISRWDDATIQTVMSDESTPQPPQPSEMELLRAEMRAGFQSTRRHIDVVVESLRSDFQGVIDKTTATGEKVDRLIASNGVEHAAFLEAITDHEVRITRLEKG